MNLTTTLILITPQFTESSQHVSVSAQVFVVRLGQELAHRKQISVAKVIALDRTVAIKKVRITPEELIVIDARTLCFLFGFASWQCRVVSLLIEKKLTLARVGDPFLKANLNTYE